MEVDGCRGDGGGGQGGDLWELLIQGAANAHIHEDLELPLRLQRSELCFPLRMPSSTLNTVRSLFPSPTSPTSHSTPPPPPLPTATSFSQTSAAAIRDASAHLLIRSLLSSAELANVSLLFIHLLLASLSPPPLFSSSSSSSNPHPLFSPQARRLASPCLDADRLPRLKNALLLLFSVVAGFFFFYLGKCAASVF